MNREWIIPRIVQDRARTSPCDVKKDKLKNLGSGEGENANTKTKNVGKYLCSYDNDLFKFVW